jgi:hypothetical protein
MSAKSAKSASSGKSAKSASSGKSAKSYNNYHTSTDTYTTEECCDTSTLSTSTSSTSTNLVSTLISIPTIIIPSSSTITFTTSSLKTSGEQINSSFLENNENNSSQKKSAIMISVISFSILIISAIFVITMLNRKKKSKRDVNIIENQHYVGNVSYEEPVPIIEQVIDSYYGTVEDTIIYENDGDEDGYLYTLPQNDCEQAIFDKSYDIIPTNQKQSNLYDKATQEEVLYDLGNNNYTYNDFC